jgi:DNA/RNA-binding domain of Phe-tRNA-synthetase-like protein
VEIAVHPARPPGGGPDQTKRRYPVFHVDEEWSRVHVGASAGALALEGVTNPSHHPVLEAEKAALEESLRSRFAGDDRRDIAELPVFQAYAAYYKRFRKTYQVQAQLESVALRGKAIPQVGALVTAMFMAELKNGILTGGHDLDTLALPVRLKVSTGEETMTLLNDREQQLKAGDMYMGDRTGVISDVLYGLEKRTMIGPATTKVFFSIYGVPPIPAQTIRSHIDDIVEYIRVFSPRADVVLKEVVG